MYENKLNNTEADAMSCHDDIISRIWDACCRGESDSVRLMLEEQVYFIVKTVEMYWTERPLDPYGKHAVAWILEGLIDRLERNGNVVIEIDVGGERRLEDCLAMCRTMLPRFSDDVTPEL
jgi:hypothetical protein